MKVLVVSHKTDKDIGSLDPILVERGYDVTRILSYMDAIETIDPLGHDLAIFTGGPMGVYQAEDYPYLKQELKYLEKRVANDKPVLGICLGAQLLAKALGSDVFPGSNGKEIGWVDVRVNEDGMKTPVRHLDAGQTKMMQWHGDTFKLPEGAVRLASSDLYKNQAYSYGKNIMALQCHPEVQREIIELWLACGSEELEENNLTVQGIRADSKKNLLTLQHQTQAFFNEWLDEVLGAAS
ncbi:MAG: gamma-glutamyl-gamma-aminobutyrate hydrolase family protein [Alphaproteobacteria bacterium]|nr:gamma-glutamyl-gamma-aminobutyrate hydrolase family protein [Alphaproteobacteria bacterium]